MLATLKSYFKTGTRLICAGGHDHTLQIIEGEKEGPCALYLVSGAASDTTPVENGIGSQFSSSSTGFLIMDRKNDGTYMLSAVEVKMDGKNYSSQVRYSAEISLP